MALLSRMKSAKGDSRLLKGYNFTDYCGHTFHSVVMDVITLQRLQNLMEPVLEPLIRRVVKEELDSSLRKYIISTKRNPAKDIDPSEFGSLQLRFSNTISCPVFSGIRIEAEGCTPMEVVLVDALTGQIIFSGLGSSAKVEIVVLEGDFGTDVGDSWTIEEFTNNIVREREGKKPLLSGDVSLSLKDGIGLVSDILFTDNSSWTRSRKFRLGARVVDRLGGVRVREARSEPFIVRDHRGELYKKHHPPSLCDKVWRLEKIGKDGAFHKRLSKERVNTVQDFLLLLSLNPIKLRHILGTGMSAKTWKVTVQHAQTCILDNKLFSYNASGFLQKNCVVFNVVGQVMGMFSNDHYVPTDKLSEAEKTDARELVISAFGDRDKILPFNYESSINTATSSSLSDAQSSSKFIPESAYHQDLSTHKIVRLPYSQQESSTPDYTHSLRTPGGFDDYFLHNNVNLMELRYDQPLSFHSQVTDLCDTYSMTRAFSTNEQLQYFERDCSLQSPSLELSPAFNYDVFSSIDQSPKGWNILLSVFKWCFSIKRIVARKNRGDI